MDAPKREQDKLTSFLGENKDGSTMFLCSLCGKAIKWNKRSNSTFVINKYKDDKSNSITLNKKKLHSNLVNPSS